MSPTASTPQPAFWNLLSLAIPGVAFLTGAAVLRSSRSTDFAGALGDVLILAAAMSACGAAGEAAAFAAIYKGERLAGLSVLGAALNFVLLIPGALILIKKASQS